MSEESTVVVTEESGSLSETSTGIARPSWIESDESASEDAAAANSESKAEETAKDSEDKGDENDSGEDSNKDTTTKGDEKKPDDKPAGDKEDKPDDDAKDETETKAPKGYVTQAALTEARAKKRLVSDELVTTKEQLDQALARVRALEANPQAKVLTFVEKTEEELRELIQDGEDEEVLKYYKNLDTHKQELAKGEMDQKEQLKVDEHFRVQTAIAAEEIEIILGDEEQTALLTERLEKEGFGDDLYFLVNPATKIVAEDGKTHIPLAGYASKLLSVLSKLDSTSVTEKTEITEVEQVPEVIRQKIIEQEQQNILEKVKGTERRTSLDDVASSASESDESEFAGKSYAELTPEERKRYTAGG